MLAGTLPFDDLDHPLSAKELLLLSSWLSPSFPIGAFSYSHGLESVIVSGVIKDHPTLANWLTALVERGSGWGDAVLLAEAWQATVSEDLDRLASACELALAMAPSAERLLETRNLGIAFFEAVTAGWPCQLLDRFNALKPRMSYPIAVGAAAAAHGLPLEVTLAGYLNGFISNLISVAVRLVPLGQTTGLKALGELQPLALATAWRAAISSLDDLGSTTILSDIAAMRHETLQSRVFRS